MDAMVALIAVWGLVTILFFALVFYRSRITKRIGLDPPEWRREGRESH